MPLTGNIPRTLGHILLALGIIAFVLAVVSFILSGVILDKAVDEPAFREDAGDMMEALVVSGVALLAGGIAGIVVGLALVGLGRGLRDRLERRERLAAPGASAPQADATPSTPAQT